MSARQVLSDALASVSIFLGTIGLPSKLSHEGFLETRRSRHKHGQAILYFDSASKRRRHCGCEMRLEALNTKKPIPLLIPAITATGLTKARVWALWLEMIAAIDAPSHRTHFFAQSLAAAKPA